MGWTVLYIAFGVVALWLLGEVLLQYKARLRWRLLAFTGFLCVVAGALIPSVVVIGLGIAAFATGQTFVTLSYRRGFAAGWALSGVPGARKGRREEEPEPELEGAPPLGELEAPEPVPALSGQAAGYGSDTFEMSAVGANGYRSEAFESNGYETRGLAAVDSFSPAGYDSYETQSFDSYNYRPGGYDSGQYATNGYDGPQTGQQPSVPVYQPGPLPDETGEITFGGYDGFGYPSADQRGIYPDQADQQQYSAYADPYYGYDGNAGYTGTSSFESGYDTYGGGYGAGEQPGYGTQSPYGTGAADGFATDGYGSDAYGVGGYGGDVYGSNGYGSDSYGSSDGYGTMYGSGGAAYGEEQSYFPQAPTGGGGVWVPQQRDPNDQAQPGQQAYPYQNGDPNGYGAQGNGYYY